MSTTYIYIEDSNGVGYKLKHNDLKLELIKSMIGETINYPAISQAPKILEISGVVLLLEDGSSYNRADYPDLAKKIGGTGDTFEVPNSVDNTSRIVASQGTKYRDVEIGSKNDFKNIKHVHEKGNIDINLSSFYRVFNSISNDSIDGGTGGLNAVVRYLNKPSLIENINVNRYSNDEDNKYKEKSFCEVPYIIAKVNIGE